MGRKKRNRSQLKPFCFYCDREFDDEKVLIQHQKAKHFKCGECNRKLDTATGLVVHMLQVHKETISRVPNANSGRDNPELIIHGMDGVPIELMNERQAKHDEERGAARHSKSAHTTFGMSVMSGFINQMSGGPHGMPPMAGFGMGPPNPFVMNQFMSQMQQDPQAAFTAMFGLPPPKLEGSRFPGPSGIAGPTPAPSTSATGVPGAVPGSGFGGLSGFSSMSIPIVPAQSTVTTSSRLPGTFTTALAARTSRLVFDPSDDTMSPEELRSQLAQYAQYCSSPSVQHVEFIKTDPA